MRPATACCHCALATNFSHCCCKASLPHKHNTSEGTDVGKRSCNSDVRQARAQEKSSTRLRARHRFLERQCGIDLPLSLEQALHIVSVPLVHSKEVRPVHGVEEQSNDSVRITMRKILRRLGPRAPDRCRSALRVRGGISELKSRTNEPTRIIHRAVQQIVVAQMDPRWHMIIYPLFGLAFDCQIRPPWSEVIAQTTLQRVKQGGRKPALVVCRRAGASTLQIPPKYQSSGSKLLRV